MKHVGLWAVGIGVLASVGLLTVTQGYAGDDDGATKCTVKTLKGRYLFGGGSATLFPPAFGVKEVSVGSAAGYHIFNGDGTGKDIVTFIINGNIVLRTSPLSTTYTLNPDCTGTVTVLGGPHADIFVSPNGDELAWINTDPGFVATLGPDRRVAPK